MKIYNTPIDEFIRDEKNKSYIKEVEEYFKLKYRGAFYVQMKVEMIKKLRSMKYKTKDVAKIIYGDDRRHDVVVTMSKHHSDIEQAEDVRLNMDKWIKEKVYPISYYKDFRRKAYLTEKCDKDGFVTDHTLTYKLETINQLS